MPGTALKCGNPGRRVKLESLFLKKGHLPLKALGRRKGTSNFDIGRRMIDFVI